MDVSTLDDLEVDGADGDEQAPPVDIAGDFEVSSTEESAEEIEAAAAAAPVDAGAKPRTREGKAKSIQAEIDRDVARRETAKREADAEESRLAAIRARSTADTAGDAAANRRVGVDGDSDPEPTLESCGNDENKFLRDYGKWEMREAAREVLAKRDAARQREESARTANEQVESALAAFSTTLDTNVGKDKRADFLKQVDPIAQQLVPYGSLPPGQHPTGLTAIADSIIASSIPEKLLLHFTANPAEFARIGALHPNQALREVGILEGKLSAAAASVGPASRPKASAAPPPSKPIGGSPSVSVGDDEDDDDDSPEAMDRYIRRMNSKDARARSRR